MPITYAPLRTLREVEELERLPLEQRIFSWDLNDWIARGCASDPAKVAIRYIGDADPDGPALCIRYGFDGDDSSPLSCPRRAGIQ